jgi:tetratricopeptide (TPR) repeat protein
VLTNQTIDPTKDPNQKPFFLWRPFVAVWHWLVPPTVAHQDRQSSLARWVAGGIAASVCITLTTLAIVYAKPIQDSWQKWRSDKMVEDARRLAQDGQVVNAVMKAQQAYQMSPDNPNALRLNGEFFSAMKRNEAVYFLEKLEAAGGATASDRQVKIRALMNIGRQKEASAELERLLKSTPPSESLMKLSEDVWGVRQRNSRMLPLIKGYVDKNPDDEANLMRMAVVQINSSLPGEVAEGIRILWDLADKDDKTGLQAIDYLNQLQSLPPDENARLIERLQEHPDATGWHYVAALKREIQSNPSRRTNIVSEAVESAKGKSREDLVPIVRWLVEEKQFLQVLSLVTLEEAKAYQPILENYLTALTMLGRVDQIEAIVEDPKIENIINRTLLAFYRAHLAYVTNQPEQDFRTKLITAKNAAAAEGRGQMLLSIGKYAEQRGQNDIAAEAYNDAALNRATERPGYEGLLRCRLANGNTPGLFDAAREAVRRWPDDESYMENYLYSCMLIGHDMELALYNARKLLSRQPSNHPAKLLVALGYWRLHNYRQASGYLQNMDLNELSEGQRAVYAGIAASAGFKKEAGEIARSIAAKATMLPEERVMFEAIPR